MSKPGEEFMSRVCDRLQENLGPFGIDVSWDWDFGKRRLGILFCKTIDQAGHWRNGERLRQLITVDEPEFHSGLMDDPVRWADRWATEVMDGLMRMCRWNPPTAPEPDWRATEMIPEDFYAR